MLTFPWPTAHPHRRARIALGTLLLLAVAAVTGYGLLATRNAEPAGQAHLTAASNPPDPATAAMSPALAPTGSAPILATADPVAFATTVARALFDWDTTGQHTLAEHEGRLLAVADPSGVESPGLVADLEAYLPSVQTWDFLTQYETRQWIEVTDARVPGQWRETVTAAEGALAPGTTAVTVTGVRHRAGTWEGREVAEEFDVAFTAIVVCGPTYPQCYLLRLSRLDEPLR
ncbi:cell wall protein [Georgenia satyanarayanai]|uniref:cell wall protein n=1 Tax=Georgenia satyanarayanai TaxID=860221 RepID=UPI0012642C40|nr:cell wall protein [Georgenia satyanarayanai]